MVTSTRKYEYTGGCASWPSPYHRRPDDESKSSQEGPAAPATKQEAQPEAKPAAKKTVPATDWFGSREGSPAAAINAAIATSPQGIEALVAASKQSAARVRGHLKHLIGKGLVVESAKGFAAKAK